MFLLASVERHPNTWSIKQSIQKDAPSESSQISSTLKVVLLLLPQQGLKARLKESKLFSELK